VQRRTEERGRARDRSMVSPCPLFAASHKQNCYPAPLGNRLSAGEHQMFERFAAARQVKRYRARGANLEFSCLTFLRCPRHLRR